MATVLVIDDDAGLRDGLRRTLQKAGYTVLEASGWLEGSRA
jgi:DNA-binding NtrC family response regulator